MLLLYLYGTAGSAVKLLCLRKVGCIVRGMRNALSQSVLNVDAVILTVTRGCLIHGLTLQTRRFIY